MIVPEMIICVSIKLWFLFFSRFQNTSNNYLFFYFRVCKLNLSGCFYIFPFRVTCTSYKIVKITIVTRRVWEVPPPPPLNTSPWQRQMILLSAEILVTISQNNSVWSAGHILIKICVLCWQMPSMYLARVAGSEHIFLCRQTLPLQSLIDSLGFRETVNKKQFNYRNRNLKGEFPSK